MTIWTSLIGITLLVAVNPALCIEHKANFTTIEKLPPGTIIGSLIDAAQLTRIYNAAQLKRLVFTILKDPAGNSTVNLVSINNLTGMLQVSVLFKIIDIFKKRLSRISWYLSDKPTVFHWEPFFIKNIYASSVYSVYAVK